MGPANPLIGHANRCLQAANPLRGAAKSRMEVANPPMQAAKGTIGPANPLMQAAQTKRGRADRNTTFGPKHAARGFAVFHHFGTSGRNRQ